MPNRAVRLSFLAYPIVILALVAILLSAKDKLLAASRQPAAQPAPAPTSIRLEALAMRVIDDKIQVKVWANSRKPDGTLVRQELTAKDPITWTLESGDAKLYEDPGTGAILFKPLGQETLRVRPRMGDVVGEVIIVGRDPQTIPRDESTLLASGGGVCLPIIIISPGPVGGEPVMATSDRPNIDVRAVVDISVIPISNTQRVVRYQFGEYYAYAEGLGPMRITYNPDKVSEVHLKSLSDNGENFFPAAAEGRFYFVIELLDSGMKIANRDPMVLRTASTHWPPFREPMLNDQPVSFYEVNNPKAEVMIIQEQELYNYPTSELKIDITSQKIENGILTANYRFTNLTKNSGNIRWFVLGDVGEALTPTRGEREITPYGSFEVALRSKPRISGTTQLVTMASVSEAAARMTGAARFIFKNTGPSDSKMALLDRSQSHLLRSTSGDQLAK